MNSTVGLIAIVCIVLAILLGNAFIKATTSQFTNNPAESAYQGESIRKEASQISEDTNERQRRMMENMKSRMDRNK